MVTEIQFFSLVAELIHKLNAACELDFIIYVIKPVNFSYFFSGSTSRKRYPLKSLKRGTQEQCEYVFRWFLEVWRSYCTEQRTSDSRTTTTTRKRFHLTFFRVFKKETLPKAWFYLVFHQKCKHGYFYWRRLIPIPIANYQTSNILQLVSAHQNEAGSLSRARRVTLYRVTLILAAVFVLESKCL